MSYHHLLLTNIHLRGLAVGNDADLPCVVRLCLLTPLISARRRETTRDDEQWNRSPEDIRPGRPSPSEVRALLSHGVCYLAGPAATRQAGGKHRR